MNELARQIREVGATTPEPDALAAAARKLVEASGEPLTIRGARDTFSSVMKRARRGELQVIGRKPDEMAVLISLKGLVEMIRETPSTQSFADALIEAGYVPIRVELELGFERSGPLPDLYGHLGRGDALSR